VATIECGKTQKMSETKKKGPLGPGGKNTGSTSQRKTPTKERCGGKYTWFGKNPTEKKSRHPQKLGKTKKKKGQKAW